MSDSHLVTYALHSISLPIASFSAAGKVLDQNDASVQAYGHIDRDRLPEEVSAFAARFTNPADGAIVLQQALISAGGRWEHEMRTQTGTRIHSLDIKVFRDPQGGNDKIVMIEYDMTDLRLAEKRAENAERKMREGSLYDPLTGLRSLTFLRESADLQFSRIGRDGGNMALMFINLLGFQGLVQQHGSDMGDAILQAVANRLRVSLRMHDQIARIGGAEYVMLQSDLGEMEAAALVAQKITDGIEEPLELFGQTVTLGACIGIAFFPQHGETLDDLMRAADEAMVSAKEAGKSTFMFA